MTFLQKYEQADVQVQVSCYIIKSNVCLCVCVCTRVVCVSVCVYVHMFVIVCQCVTHKLTGFLKI